MISEQVVKDLLKQQESEQIEFLEVSRRDVVGRVICSFLNNEGGQLLIGVSDDLEIKGITNASKVAADLEQFLFDELVPEAPVMISVETFKGAELILMKIWAGSKKPYVFSGSIFYRKGAQTVQASSKEISNLIHDRQKTDFQWERQAALGIELPDFDVDEINATMETALSGNRMKETVKTPLDFLSFYGLFQNGQFTNASVILFSLAPFRFLPQSRVRIAVLEGGKTGDKFASDELLEGNIFDNVTAIQKFLEKNLTLTGRFSEKSWQRSDDFLYPMSALREGVINALVHSDYSLSSGSVSILIYPDRLEITNVGKLPMTVNELKKNHLSMPPNPDIAHIVFLKGYMEKIGRGTLKIIEACKDANLRTPVWSKGSYTVTLTFFNEPNDVAKRDMKLPQDTGAGNAINAGANEGADEGAVKGATGSTNKGANEGAVKGAIEGATGRSLKKILEILVEVTIKDITEKVKDNLVELLYAIHENEGKRVPDLMATAEMSESMVERYIKMFRDAKLIDFRGSAAQTGGYFLSRKTKNKLKP